MSPCIYCGYLSRLQRLFSVLLHSLKARLPTRGNTTQIFHTLFVLFYCSPITQKPAKSFYIYLHILILVASSRVALPRIGKRVVVPANVKVRLHVRSCDRKVSSFYYVQIAIGDFYCAKPIQSALRRNRSRSDLRF